MMASDVLAMLDQLPAVAGDVQPSISQELINRAERHPAPNASGLLYGLGMVAPPDLARRALAAAERLESKGGRRPTWASGPARFVRGWIGSDVYRDREIVLAEFQHPGQPPHALTLLIDPNLGGLLKDVIVSESADEMLAQWSGEQLDVVFEEATGQQVAGRLSQGLDAAELYASSGLVDKDVSSARALLTARLKALPVAAVEDEPEMDGDARSALVERFIASPEASDVIEPELVVRCAIDFKVDHGDGDPLRWSPELVTGFLLDWFPRKVTIIGETVDRVPDVLRAWVRFAGRQKGLGPHLVSATEHEIDACREQFLQTWDDPRSYGPAKTMVLALAQNGIDVLDPDAVQAWCESHANSPWTEWLQPQNLNTA